MTYPDQVDALHERVAPGRLVSSPTGHVLASTARLRGPAQGPAPGPAPRSLTMLGLGVADAGPECAFGAGATADRFAAGLLDLHRDLLRQTLRQVMDHLGGRTSGGSTLLSRQLVQGELADIAMRLAGDDAMPASGRAGSPAARWRTHQLYLSLGRRLLRLLGASGFLMDGPAAPLHLAEVTGNVYLHPATEDPDD